MMFQYQHRGMYDDTGFPGYSQGSSTRGFHTLGHYERGLCFDRGELLPSVRDTEEKQSRMIRPTQEATKDPSCDRWSINILYPSTQLTSSDSSGKRSIAGRG